MFDIHTLSEFSREHCISICAFLVPANLLATIHTGVLVGIDRPQAQIYQAAALASLPAIALFGHVLAWFAIGVVMIPTYVLVWLGSTCLLINLWAAVRPQRMRQLFHLVYRRLSWLKVSF